MKTTSLAVGVFCVVGLLCSATLAQELQQPPLAQRISSGEETISPLAVSNLEAASGTNIGLAQPVGYDVAGTPVAYESVVGRKTQWTPGYAGYGSRSYGEDNGDLQIGGWIDQGFSAVANNPADRFNGVVGMNDRHAEYQLNQMWLFLERKTAVRGDGWDLGGRVDLLYGTDAYFIQCRDGLEATWDQRERFYQAALPQFYFDVAYNDFTFTMGHFLSPLEWESYMAPENFFYSHSYAFMYGVPGTFTGGMLTWDFSDQAQVFAGMHRGGDQFDDTDGLNALNFLAGASWISEDERTYMEFAIDAEEMGPGDAVTMMAWSLSQKLGRRWDYMFETVWGHRERCGNDWYGINQHLVYKINCCWSVGARLEWFRDDDGRVVYGFRPGNAVAHDEFIGNFWEITLGINWKPRENVIVRNEVRWDWYDETHAGGPLPYDAGDSAHQFLYGVDVVWTF